MVSREDLDGATRRATASDDVVGTLRQIAGGGDLDGERRTGEVVADLAYQLHGLAEEDDPARDR